MSIAGSSGPPRFTVGGVIATTFSVLFRNLVRFVAIILIVGVPVIGFFIGGAMLLSGELTSTGAGFDVRFSGASGFETLFVIASMLLMVLGYLLVLNALVHGTLESLSGRTASIAGSLSAGLSALPRTFFASLLVIIVGVLIGFMVMMFMGLLLSVLMLSALLSLGLSLVALMVLARILVFVPAIVAERAGVLECFGRSQELTREHRWGLFGIMLLLTAVNWVIPSPAPPWRQSRQRPAMRSTSLSRSSPWPSLRR